MTKRFFNDRFIYRTATYIQKTVLRRKNKYNAKTHILQKSVRLTSKKSDAFSLRQNIQAELPHQTPFFPPTKGVVFLPFFLFRNAAVVTRKNGSAGFRPYVTGKSRNGRCGLPVDDHGHCRHCFSFRSAQGRRLCLIPVTPRGATNTSLFHKCFAFPQRADRKEIADPKL